MNNRSKNVLYSIILFVSVFAVWWYRKNQVPVLMRMEGETMGTTYHISYFDGKKRDFKKSVDSILVLVNQSINTYDSASEVSRFNRGNGIKFSLPYLLPPLRKAQEVVKASHGAFDPTVMPLVNAWGFGPVKGKPIPTDKQVDSIRSFIGFEKIQFSGDSLWKIDPRAQLDFGGIGQGYGADVVSDFLKSKGINNMLIELGGEGMAVGRNLEKNKPWELGILDPQSTRDSLFYKAYVSLENKGYSTSGNYFNYREVNGQKFSHTIDPETGHPVQRSILSASVFARDCMTADAWATAFMVMGHEKAFKILNDHPELNVFFVYSEADGKINTFSSEGIKSLITTDP